jgi:DNA adenine methylase
VIKCASQMHQKESADSANELCPPFLKWAGGKRWFVSRHLDKIPSCYTRYIEPFLGSGAMYFALQPQNAVLADLNCELIETFLAIREDWKSIANHLTRYQQRHSKTFYYAMRRSQPRSAIARAARFIYLNRTCWNGLYRVNLQGQFNVPKGTKKRVVLETDDFERVHHLLQNATLTTSDFEPVIDMAREGDLIFADPPYITAHANNGFVKYNEKLFSWKDQIRLRDSLLKAARRGAFVLSTNADTSSIRDLYRGHFRIMSTSRASVIASSSLRRGIRIEAIITSL